MIGLTKILTGKVTISGLFEGGNEPSTLQFLPGLPSVVVWNLTERCNLRCRHCYIEARGREKVLELTTGECKAVLRDLARMKVRVLLFSGGEPLVREDLFTLCDYGASLGLRVCISSNGTLVTRDVSVRLRDSGVKYVGVSLDGRESTHDKFRGLEDSFKKALNGIYSLLRAGVKAGVRFTLTRVNISDLEWMLGLCAKEGIPRFCMYHLVYAGRGRGLANWDVSPGDRLEVWRLLIRKVEEFSNRGIDCEVLTTDNHADGVMLYEYIKARDPSRAQEVLKLLEMHGGCSAGTKVLSIDPKGFIRPCQFWSDESLGNVRDASLDEIWHSDNPILFRLRRKGNFLRGRCGKCDYRDLCGGCRVRARFAMGDVWGEDPQCFIRREEG